MIYDAFFPPDALTPDNVNFGHFTEDTSAVADLPDLASPVQAFQPREGGIRITELWSSEKEAVSFHKIQGSQPTKCRGVARPEDEVRSTHTRHLYHSGTGREDYVVRMIFQIL